MSTTPAGVGFCRRCDRIECDDPQDCADALAPLPVDDREFAGAWRLWLAGHADTLTTSDRPVDPWLAAFGPAVLGVFTDGTDVHHVASVVWHIGGGTIRAFVLVSAPDRDGASPDDPAVCRSFHDMDEALGL